jgi:hypothetical protein
MLDLIFKTLYFVSSLIGYEQGKAIIQEYDRKIIFYVFKVSLSFASFS